MGGSRARPNQGIGDRGEGIDLFAPQVFRRRPAGARFPFVVCTNPILKTKESKPLFEVVRGGTLRGESATDVLRAWPFVPVPNPRGMICWALGKSYPPASASSRILRTMTRRKLLRVVEIANIFSNDRAIARLDELPGFGIVFIAGPRRVLDRRADVSANLRSSARAGHLRRGSRRLGACLR